MSKTKKDRRDVEKKRDADKKRPREEEPQELDEFGIPYL